MIRWTQYAPFTAGLLALAASSGAGRGTARPAPPACSVTVSSPTGVHITGPCVAQLVASASGNVVSISTLGLHATTPAGVPFTVSAGLVVKGALATGSWTDGTLSESAMLLLRMDAGTMWSATNGAEHQGSLSLQLTRLGPSATVGGATVWSDFDASIKGTLFNGTDRMDVAITVGGSAAASQTVASAPADSGTASRRAQVVPRSPVSYQITMDGVAIGRADAMAGGMQVDSTTPQRSTPTGSTTIRTIPQHVVFAPVKLSVSDGNVIRIFAEWYKDHPAQHRLVAVALIEDKITKRTVTLTDAVVARLTITPAVTTVMLSAPKMTWTSSP